jgi:voltage-gated potassium channel Kch
MDTISDLGGFSGLRRGFLYDRAMMKKRVVRFFALPAFALVASLSLVYDSWVAADPVWRFPKVEIVALLFFVIVVATLLHSTIAFVRTAHIVPGIDVVFDVSGRFLVARVLVVGRHDVVVRTPAGPLRVDRGAIADVVKHYR